MRKLIATIVIILGGSLAFAQLFPNGSGYSGYLSNESALAYNKQFAIDLAPYDAQTISAEVNYGSATIANVTWVDGAQSTGALTVVDYTKLSSASATAQFTVVSTKTLGGAVLRVGPYTFTSGQEWVKQNTKQLTAAAIASAITTTISGFSASANNGVVYATAPYGDAYNYWAFSSNNSSITASAASLRGGRDRAVITINGVTLTSGSDWFASVSSVTTAASIVTALNANTSLSATLRGTSGTTLAADYGVVNIKSIYNCASCNYTLTSSTPAALSASFSRLYGGADPQDVLGSSVFTKTAPHSLTLALPVLYTAGSAAIGGLTDQTTYYAIPTTSLKFQLARCSSCAVAGASQDIVVVTSTNTQIASSMHTYTLAPLAISGTPSFKWQVSNDNSNWVDLGVSSVTVTSYTYGNAQAGWDFGQMGFRYLRLNALSPSTGGLVLQTQLQLNK